MTLHYVLLHVYRIFLFFLIFCIFTQNTLHIQKSGSSIIQYLYKKKPNTIQIMSSPYQYIQPTNLYPRPSPYLEQNLYKFAIGPSKTLLPVINQLETRTNAAKLSSSEYYNSNSFFRNNVSQQRQQQIQSSLPNEKDKEDCSDINAMKCYCCMKIIRKYQHFYDDFGNHQLKQQLEKTQMEEQCQFMSQDSSKKKNNVRNKTQHQLLLFGGGYLAPEANIQQLEKQRYEIQRQRYQYENVEVIGQGQSNNTLQKYFYKKNKEQQSIEIEGEQNKKKKIVGNVENKEIEIFKNLNMKKCYECSRFVCNDCVRFCRKCKKTICKFDYQEDMGVIEEEGILRVHKC